MAYVAPDTESSTRSTVVFQPLDRQRSIVSVFPRIRTHGSVGAFLVVEDSSQATESQRFRDLDTAVLASSPSASSPEVGRDFVIGVQNLWQSLGSPFGVEAASTHLHSSRDQRTRLWTSETVAAYLQPIEGADGEPPWLPVVEDQVLSLLRLPDNWDSFGASSIHTSAVTTALNLLRDCTHGETPPPSAIPTPNGGVQLEWNLVNSALELEVYPNGRLGVLFVDRKTGEEFESDSFDDENRLRQWVSVLSRR